jgi:hypothetical protein
MKKIICPKCEKKATEGVIDRVVRDGKKRWVHIKMSPCGCVLEIQDNLTLKNTRELLDGRAG